MTSYVAGFLFSTYRCHLAVVEKCKPAWQAGKLNGIGGKIEPGELPIEAMIREFEEEAGVRIETWDPVAVLKVLSTGAVVHFFAAFDSHLLATVRTVEEEKIHIMGVDLALRDPRLMPGLRTLIPLAQDQSGIVKPVYLEDSSSPP